MSDDTLNLYRRQGFGTSLGVPSHPALLIIDFINGFADPLIFGGGNIGEAILATIPVLEEARRRRWPVAHTRTVFQDDGVDANVFTMKAPKLLALTELAHAAAIVPELRPREDELVVRKTVPSAFFETGLRSWLTRHRVDSLVVTGCVTSGCVRASVHDAMCCGFRPFVLEDCVGDRALEPHRANLFDMAQKNADVLSFKQFNERLARKIVTTELSFTHRSSPSN